MIKTLSVAAALMAAASLFNVSHAQDGASLFTSKGCLACHGIDANTPITDNIPKLAGQNKTYLAQQIKDIGSGARNNGQTAQMKLIASKLSDAEIDAIATYLSGL